MNLWVSKGEYLKKVIDNEMEKFIFDYNKSKLIEYKEKRVPFVVMYHAPGNNFKKIINAISKKIVNGVCL